jgi:hypothetical protein
MANHLGLFRVNPILAQTRADCTERSTGICGDATARAKHGKNRSALFDRIQVEDLLAEL